MRHVLPSMGLVALALVTTPIVSACQSHGSDDGKAAEGEGASDGGSSPARDDRIPTLNDEPAGLAPGYLDGAMIYASWRAGVMQELLRTVPVAPGDARDLAELGAVLGVDPRVDGMLAHLGIDPNARISMSVRPAVTFANDVRAAIESQNAAMVELTGSGAGPIAERPEFVPPDPIPPDWEPPPTPQIPEAKPLSPAARELDRKARSLGIHVRIHVPSVDPRKLDTLVANLSRELQRDRWGTTCAALGATRVCGGESDHVVVVRDVPNALQIDMLLTFLSDFDAPDDEFRRALIQEAVNLPAATSLPAVERLRGDAVLLVDGPATVETLRASAIARDLANRRDLDVGTDFSRDRQRRRDAAIRSLHETQRIFGGISVELSWKGDNALAVGRWLPTEFGRAHMAEVFELTKIDADVPSMAALCDGALICGRSRGMPDRRRFAALATGIYADATRFGELVDDHDEAAAAILLLETWPNAIGTTAQLPGNAVSGPEAIIVQNVIDIASRVLGLGFSVRSLNVTNRGLSGDWVSYARMSAGDIAAVRGFLQMAELRMAAATISGVDSRVEFVRLPEDDVTGNLYAIYDPAASTGEWGWMVIADGDDRVRWLDDLAHDDGSVPLAYLEFGDLWRLISSFGSEANEVAYAQSWLSGRWIRGQVSLGADGAPEVRVAMGKI